MMQFKIVWNVDKDIFTLSIHFTDGIEPVLETDKMKEIKRALPQIGDAQSVEIWKSQNHTKYGGNRS